jgi:hypothetical protein
MAYPSTVALKKSLLVFIGVSFFVGLGTIGVQKSSGKFTTIGSGVPRTTSPSEWMFLRWVDFLMRQPTRPMQKITHPDSGRVFPEIASQHTSLSFEDINDGVLFAVVVNAGLR